jgi:hypothetical protein
VETFEEAFMRAIKKKDTLSPSKLPLAQYRKNGGQPLPPPWIE